MAPLFEKRGGIGFHAAVVLRVRTAKGSLKDVGFIMFGPRNG